MKVKTLILTILLLPCMSVFGDGKPAQVSPQQLSDIKKLLKVKESEKDKLVLQKNFFKEEVKSLSSDIEKTNKKLEKYMSDIKNAQDNLKNSSKRCKFVSSCITDLNRTIVSEVNLFNKMALTRSYERNPIEYKFRRKLLKRRKRNLKEAQKIGAITESNVKKWETTKKQLLNLHQKETKVIAEQKNMFVKKNESLEMTSNKILSVEHEIKTLNDNARALQRLINKISAANVRESAARKSGSIIPEIIKKRAFAWPIKGNIIVNFGKNKHPELDTYLISNGIKISSADFNEVKSIDSGIVVFSGQFRSYGKVVIIDHGNSVFAVYGLLDKIFVKEEQKVLKSSVIGKLGKGEKRILYFEIRYKNTPYDPLIWLQQK